MAGLADEDGVLFLSALEHGTTATLQVVSSAEGKLDAWIDFNLDGEWQEPGERVFFDEGLDEGENMLDFFVPDDAKYGLAVARFRLTSAGEIPFDGLALDGEVEDYQVFVEGRTRAAPVWRKYE